MKTILVINAGSTSVKYKFFSNEDVLLDGMFEKIGEDRYEHKDYLTDIRGEIKESEYLEALNIIKELLASNFQLLPSDINAIGFRVVHGGENFVTPTLLTSEVLDEIEELSELAPLHNPPALEKIREANEVFLDVPKYAVFDTEFHSTLPEKAYLYAIPYKFYRENKIRRYGFHGISHEYLSKEISSKFEIDNSKLITCHLGGGASITAIKDGKSIDTSMGFTPLEGLVMATRAGDVDDGVQDFMETKLGYSEAEIYKIFNNESGLLGLSEETSDMRWLRDNYHTDVRAKRAIDVYTYRIQKYIGSYIAALGGLDVLVFSAGVGAGSDVIRNMICDRLKNFGIEIDPNLNDGKVDVSENLEIGKGKVKIFVIPTNEELMIVRKIRNLNQ